MDGDAERTAPEPYKSLHLPSYLDSVIGDKDRTETARVPEPNDVVSPAFLAHVVLVTTRLQAMKRWYSDVLGAEYMFVSEKMAFLTFNEDHHQIAIFDNDKIAADKGVEPDVCGLHHMAFTYQGLAELVHTYKRLKGLGILPFRSINHGTTLSNYYLDPDNNRVELQVDTFPNKADLNRYLAGRAFNRNPIGVLLDFEEVVERFERGDAPLEICSPSLMHHGEEDEAGRPTL